MKKIDPKDKHIHKTNIIIYKHIWRVEHVCNSGTTLQNFRKEGKERGLIKPQQC
jgi:hypothetical protein